MEQSPSLSSQESLS